MYKAPIRNFKLFEAKQPPVGPSNYRPRFPPGYGSVSGPRVISSCGNIGGAGLSHCPWGVGNLPNPTGKIFIPGKGWLGPSPYVTPTTGGGTTYGGGGAAKGIMGFLGKLLGGAATILTMTKEVHAPTITDQDICEEQGGTWMEGYNICIPAEPEEEEEKEVAEVDPVEERPIEYGPQPAEYYEEAYRAGYRNALNEMMQGIARR